MAELQTKLHKLRGVADSLESVHHGATIGSLTGGVIGAVGGIASIVGLILSPLTMGASLAVTGIGVGVGTLGGVTAGASNIVNMVNQSSDRKAVRSIIKEFEEKMNAVVTWLQEISNSLQTLKSLCDSADTGDSQLNEDFVRLGLSAGKGLGGIAELVRLVQVMKVSKVAAQTSRIVRVAEVATGILSGLFVAVDIFFIAMDAREIQDIRQAKAAEEGGATCSKTETGDQATLLNSSLPDTDKSEAQDTAPNGSEIMKFVKSIRQAADNLQKVLDELKSSISSIPSLGDEREQERRDMESM